MKITRTMELNHDYSWTDLKKAADEGRLNAILRSGDKLPLILKDGQNIGLDVGKDENGKMYFIFRDMMTDGHVMNPNWTNEGSWAASEMRRYVNEDVINLLPDDLRVVIKPTKIVQIIDGEKITTEDELFCLSHTQVFGGTLFKEREPEDTQIDIFRMEKDRVKQRDSKTWSWWLRSAYDASYFGRVASDGDSYDSYANGSGGVVQGFCL